MPYGVTLWKLKGQPTFFTARLPHDFDMETRIKLLNLMGKNSAIRGKEISPVICQVSIYSATLAYITSAACSTGSNIIFIRQVRHGQLRLQPS